MTRARDKLREQYTTRRDEFDRIPYWPEGSDPETDLPMILRVPAQSWLARQQERFNKNQINNETYELLLVIHCVFAPKLDEATDRPITHVGEDGDVVYEYDERIFDESDLDFFRDPETHQVGGWLFKLRRRILKFVEETAEKRLPGFKDQAQAQNSGG